MKKILLLLTIFATLSLAACANTNPIDPINQTFEGTIKVYTRDTSSGTRD